ncbi:hypothetical protein BJX61DRAFT_548671 [Aspergillus egyptiacus]|nr:hypothetical protein BJX61DRAFT_548671 [Aspergillus egyptiacus]
MAMNDTVTNVDIVAIPAIGADPEQAWAGDSTQSPWLTAELPKFIPNARVLLIDHGELSASDTIDSLAERLLNKLQEARKSTSARRPFFLICHSTGGVVATAALSRASQSRPPLDSILLSCYGIVFLATPHYGSSYLSAPEFARSIHRLFRLKYNIPSGLREAFRPRHQMLERLAGQFRAISADIKIWTFLETVDSVFTLTDSETGSTIDMHVPITSIRSGLLGFEHETELPLATDHIGTASFKGQEGTARLNFMKELQSAVSVALELSTIPDVPLQVEQEIMVHVNAFFEDTARGISNDTPLQLWSAKSPLEEYLDVGPSKCLEERLKKSSRLSSSTFEGSSVSELESRPTSAQAISSHRSPQSCTSGEPELIPFEVASSRPSVRRSKSFLVQQTSPRIHISETPIESYFDIQSEGSASDRRFSHGDPDQDDVEGEEYETSAASLRTISPSQRNLLTSLSSRYREFLNIPQRERIPEDAPRTIPRRFDRPEPGTEKLLWIHVPYTHTDWVPPVLAKACKGKAKQNLFRNLVNAENWYSNLITARHLEPHARYVRPACIHFKFDSPPINASEPHSPQLALYLHWDTYWNLLQRRRVIESRFLQGRSRPVPDRISKSNLESKLIWKFLGNEPPIHIRRTLDQFGYPNLRSTVARDDDQMLWKRTRKRVNLTDELGTSIPMQHNDAHATFTDGKVLMVDQLWLWVIDQKTVVTFFPKQEATTVEAKFSEQTNLYNSIYNELNGDLARRFETAGDLAALIVLHAVTVLLDRTLHSDLQVLRIFEESISILNEATTKSFKQFRNKGFITNPAEYNKTPEGRLMTAEEREERDRKVAEKNLWDLSSLLELRDIVDELGTILKLLKQQAATINDMANYFEYKGCGKKFIQASLAKIEEYHTHITEMREDAIETHKAVENLLDLRQKQAHLDESRLARWEAEVTQSQSRAVMVFTIFTIIFLPLSFFTSLFGINAREWSGESTNLTLNTMLAIAGPTSLAVIISALLIAFSERYRDTLVKGQKITFGLLKDLVFFPISKALHRTSKRKSTEKTSITSSRTRTSRIGDRFSRYLTNWRYQANQEDDFWKKDDEKSIIHRNGVGSSVRRAETAPLPSVFVSEVRGNNGNGQGFGIRDLA